MKFLKSGVYFAAASQLGLASFQVPTSHMGPVAAELDGTALVPADQSSPSHPHFSSSRIMWVSLGCWTEVVPLPAEA